MMEAILKLPILSFMGITLNFSTGEIGWSSGTSSAPTDISGGLDNLLLVDGSSNLTLVSDSTNDVLLLT